MLNIENGYYIALIISAIFLAFILLFVRRK
jgi:hypothetical protein